jgi:hypothetical protein
LLQKQCSPAEGRFLLNKHLKGGIQEIHLYFQTKHVKMETKPVPETTQISEQITTQHPRTISSSTKSQGSGFWKVDW